MASFASLVRHKSRVSLARIMHNLGEKDVRSGEAPSSAGDKAMLDKLFARDTSMVFRRIADECVLVPIRKNVADVESIYTLNEVGAQIWELIDGKRRVKEIRDLIVAEFEVGLGEAEEDLLILLQQLNEIGAIHEVPKDGG